MMSVNSELASEIWAESAFHSDLAKLEIANIRTELRSGTLIGDTEVFAIETVQRLLQVALIFSEAEDEYFQEVAQRISTAALRVSSMPTLEVFALIQARLSNFPALRRNGAAPLPPPHAPRSLQYEFVGRRLRQTVVSGDESEHVLTQFQLASWNVLSNGRSAGLSGPTSSGKSYLLLLYLVEQFRSGHTKRAVYIVPTRALINQISDDAAAALAERGVRDVTITSIPIDFSSETDSKLLYVMTQERLDVLLVARPHLNLNLVIVDEAHMLADGSRGVLLESVMDKIDSTPTQSQIVFSGPLIENPEYFGDLFKLEGFATCASKRSPVTQNIIFLDYVDQPKTQVSVKTLIEAKQSHVASIDLPIRLLTDLDRLSYLSFMFGRSGASIVYAGGKADAEKIATKIAIEIERDKTRADALSELIGFVKKHVHKDYALVSTLEKGVGFHYGHMPSLLRKQLEDHFRERKIDYLVCTSTLLYGLNLPARNIFLEKPTTGRGHAISGADFWNLSGRAGRLGKEVEGNVYLIDYDKWASKPLSQGRGVSVVSALKTTIVDQSDDLIAFLDDPSISSDAHPNLEITLGKLVLDQRTDRLEQTLSRYATSANTDTLGQIRNRIQQISSSIEIPTNVLNGNLGVSVFRQKDLLDYMNKRLKQLPPEELIPAHPLGEFEAVLANHRRAFKRIHTYLLKYAGADRRHFFFAPLALRWMRGDPLPMLIDSAVQWHKSRKIEKSVATIIRETMEDVEQDLRFRYVKYFTCYNSILSVALERAGMSEYLKTVPDVPLFLEVGGSSGAMINLMALGLSRTSAEAISEYITDKEMTLPDVRSWLRQLDVSKLEISPICAREIEALAQAENISTEE